MGDVDWAVQPVSLAVQPLVHSVCTVPGGLPGVSEQFHRSTPGCASGWYYRLVTGGTNAAFQATEVPPETTGTYQEAVQPLPRAVQPLRVCGHIYTDGAEGFSFLCLQYAVFVCFPLFSLG